MRLKFKNKRKEYLSERSGWSSHCGCKEADQEQGRLHVEGLRIDQVVGLKRGFGRSLGGYIDLGKSPD